jgi:hypothetical protein
VRRLLTDTELAANISADGRERAQRYTTAAMCRATEAVYDAVLAEHPA